MKLSLLFLALSTVAFSQQSYRYLRIPHSLLTKDFVKQSGFIEDHFSDDTYAVGYLPLQARTTSTFEDLVIEFDPKEWAHSRFDVKTLNIIPDKESWAPIKEDFHTYETLTQELTTLSKKYANLVSLNTAGKTVQGRELWYFRITAKNAVPDKPKLLYISSMHGDEVTGKEMMVYLIRDLLAGYGTNTRITKLLDNAELFIMPSMNPDGTQSGQRFNANGVDLNRDFPDINDMKAFDISRAAIETKNIMALHDQHHFHVALNFHGGSLCVNIPWDSKANSSGNLFGDNNLMLSMARQFADANGPMKQNNGGNFDHGVTYGYEWYPIYGGMQDWTSDRHQSTHATVEISYTKWPSAGSLAGYWNDNKEALLKYLENGVTGIHLKVTNEAGELLDTSIGISTAKRTLNYKGYVNRPTVAGTQTVTVSAAGYQTKTLTTSATQFAGSYETVILQK